MYADIMNMHILISIVIIMLKDLHLYTHTLSLLVELRCQDMPHSFTQAHTLFASVSVALTNEL